MSGPVRVATLTCSDTRTEADDEGGAALRAHLVAAGFETVAHEIVREDVAALRSAAAGLLGRVDVDALVTTGGTGIAPCDRTIEALAALFDKELPGFGEAFRRLSWDQVGPRSILSNATAGVSKDKIVIALPGSPKALGLAVEKLIAPTLGHMVALARGDTAHKK